MSSRIFDRWGRKPLAYGEIIRRGSLSDEQIKKMYPERCMRSGLKLFKICVSNPIDSSPPKYEFVWALNENNANRKLGMPYSKRKRHPAYSNNYSNV